MQTIAIVGRTNVGKSTFFNRLCKKRIAIVHDRAGVTRDRKEALGYLYDLTFHLIDTAGLENNSSLSKSMWAQTKLAMQQADIILMLADGTAPINPLDLELAKLIHKIGKTTFLLINKCETKQAQQNLDSWYKLGLKTPYPISAEHGQGLMDLYEQLKPLFKEEEEINTNKQEGIRLAIVGRPNVGKSTLLNALLQEERVLTGPEAGITRDAISVPFSWNDTQFILTDTAGLRKRTQISDTLEKASVGDSISAINFASVVFLVLDATVPMERQEINIAVKITKEGRALIIVLNKWDKVKNPNAVLKSLQEKLNTSLPQQKGVPICTISAIKSKGINDLMQQAILSYNLWNKRIPTHKMNDFLKNATEKHKPPKTALKRPITLKYITQIASRPPTFVIFTNYPNELPDSYKNYLLNELRNAFQFFGAPIRLYFKKQENPYAKK